MDETAIWKKYRNGVDHHNNANMYARLQKAYQFFEGDQWAGVDSGGEKLPSENFIKPICKYKIATVAMNDTAIVFSLLDGSDESGDICGAINEYIASVWESLKMDTLKWSVVKAACIAGDAWVYCFNSAPQSGSVAAAQPLKIELRMVDRTSVYLADEQNPDLTQQEYIIIAERRAVRTVREEARANGIAEEEISRIVSDEANETQVGVTDAHEVKTELGKCTSVLYLEKTDEGIKFCRSVKGVIYQPESTVTGLTVYPIACMRWEEKQGSARGVSAVEPLIPNQIEVNRTLARRAICVKRFSFPTKIVDASRLSNAEALDTVGATIELDNLQGRPINNYVGYLTPVGIGTDAPNLQAEIISTTRELEGASDAATGSVDPTKASGEAIKAARDQSALTLNEQSAFYKQFVEDLSTVWFRMWVCYAQPQLAEIGDFNVKIDVSPTDPYSVLARQAALENALAQQYITFEEYVNALDDNSGLPKEKFKAIVEARQAAQLPEGLPIERMGGDLDGLPQMQY